MIRRNEFRLGFIDADRGDTNLSWLKEGLDALGGFLINPLLYVGCLYAIYLGYIRVKRERKHFHVRVQDGWYETRTYLTKGLMTGLVLSLLLFIAGIMVPLAFFITVTFVTLLLSLFARPVLLSPAYTWTLSFFLLMAIVYFRMDVPIFADYFHGLPGAILPAAAVIAALLVIGEGWLIHRYASRHTSPKIIRSKRGLGAGVHETKRLWLVPILFLIPEGALSLPIPYWPIFSIGEVSFSLFLFPALIGFGQEIHYTLPEEGVKRTGKQVMVLGMASLLVALGAYWFELLAVLSSLFMLIGRIVISWNGRRLNRQNPLYFLKNRPGIVVMDVIPGSPAAKMGIQIGEIIKSVNGVAVHNDTEFYEALHINRAFCKLEVIDRNGENRFVQQALYEGEHHELGILFVESKEQWQSDAG